ncbi:MAG: hypothetical protein MUP16_06325 [Sedimentisphaerales bacterium]|nr:hypothetical protein [Sedimentisphaerales bacterium]
MEKPKLQEELPISQKKNMNRWGKGLTAALFIVLCFTLVGQASAKTDEPSLILDDLLGKIATYEFGQSRENLTKLTDIIRESHDSTQVLKQFENRLLEFLRSDATLAGKQFICEQLSIIGTEEAVPTLAAMLTQSATSDMPDTPSSGYQAQQLMRRCATF